MLAHWRKRGMLRYKDVDAYYDKACGATINIICPQCKYRSEQHHGDKTFLLVERPPEFWDGYSWVQVTCPKCDFLFKVICRG